MAWKRLTEEEQNTIQFDFDEEAIRRGVEASIPAAEAAGLFGPERQQQAIASGKVNVTYQNGKPIYSSKQ